MSSEPLTRVGTYSDDTAPLKDGSIKYVEIFPSIGITRFGDSGREYFLTPEIPGCTSLPGGISGFRDPQQRIRRQAVRFRAYAYDANDNLLGEVNSQNGYTLTWSVHVANKKAAHTVFQGRYENPPLTALRNPKVQADVDLDLRTRLIVDPGVRSISRHPTSPTPPEDLVGNFYGSQMTPTPVSLGQLQVDAAGRLIFVPGNGRAQSVKDPNDPQPEIVSAFDSADWIDNACDGWVRVMATGPRITEHTRFRYAAAVISAPPKFAWAINAPTSLYDLMEDIYRRARKEEDALDFGKHIWPVLRSASLISWTSSTGLQGHGPLSNGYFSSERVIEILSGDDENARNALKNRIFEKLRKPNYQDPSQANVWYMPRLAGDVDGAPEPGQFPGRLYSDIKQFSALTELQYERFRQWNARTGPDRPPPEPGMNAELGPEHLTRASLESTIGSPLLPGIEINWFAEQLSTYNLGVNYRTYGFRINYPTDDGNHDPAFVQPGHITRGLSQPWQSDFRLCIQQWWPSTRPENVVPKAIYDETMGTSGTPKQFATAVTTRRLWTRGLRDDVQLGQTLTSVGIPWYANTDMTRYWSYLGIVRKDERRDKDGKVTAVAYLESERLEI